MANNRLYIYDPVTKAKIPIAKTFSHKWMSSDKAMDGFLNSVYVGSPDTLEEIAGRLQFITEDEI